MPLLVMTCPLSAESWLRSKNYTTLDHGQQLRSKILPLPLLSVCKHCADPFTMTLAPRLFVNRMLQFVPPNHEAAQQSHEEAALCLSGIAADYTWADDFIFSEKLNEEALKLAHDTLGVIRIENGLAQIREAARKQRALESLTP